MRQLPMAAALLASLAIARAALGQVPAPSWDAQRHLMVVTSALDSTDIVPIVSRSLEAEGLRVVRSDTDRGRIITLPRASDSFGGSATVQYLALVHRLHPGGCEVWIGAILRTPVGPADAATFAQIRPGQSSQEREMTGSLVFLSPNGNSPEWRRLQRVSDAVARGP